MNLSATVWQSGRALHQAARRALGFTTVWFGVILSGFGQNAVIAAVEKADDSRVSQVNPETNRLGDQFLVTVSNRSSFVHTAQQKPKAIVLFVDGRELEDVSYTVFLC